MISYFIDRKTGEYVVIAFGRAWRFTDYTTVKMCFDNFLDGMTLEEYLSDGHLIQ